MGRSREEEEEGGLRGGGFKNKLGVLRGALNRVRTWLGRIRILLVLHSLMISWRFTIRYDRMKRIRGKGVRNIEGVIVFFVFVFLVGVGGGCKDWDSCSVGFDLVWWVLEGRGVHCHDYEFDFPPRATFRSFDRGISYLGLILGDFSCLCRDMNDGIV